MMNGLNKRRKGSLATYHNSKRGLRTLVPAGCQSVHGYYVKVGMGQEVFKNNNNEDVLLPYTLIRRVPLKKTSRENLYVLQFSQLKVKRAIKKDLMRQIASPNPQAVYETIQTSPYLDVTGLTKGKGTTGIVQRRKVKKGKRKGARANCTRKFGSRGIRRHGKMDPRQPFSGKHGFSLRTILNCENLEKIVIQNLVSYRHYAPGPGVYLKVRGSVPGPTNRILKVRPAHRKL